MSVLSDLAEVGITTAKINKALANSPRVKAGVKARAEAAKAYWQSIAPVDSSNRGPHDVDGTPDESGEYRDSIKIEYRRDAHGKPYARVGTRLMPLAALIEYGSAHGPEQACRQRTADAVGAHKDSGAAEIMRELDE